MIAGVMKTVRANNKGMAHDYFTKYDVNICLANVHKLPTVTSDSDVANAEQLQADNWEHNQ